jgi:hypothetical protein
MKVTVSVPRHVSSIPDVHRYIATLASRMLEARGDNSFPRSDVPYTPNDGDPTFWTLDAGNDWKVQFPEGTVSSFEVWHRYQLNDEARKDEPNAVNDAVKALAGLLAYRLGGTVTVQ